MKMFYNLGAKSSIFVYLMSVSLAKDPSFLELTFLHYRDQTLFCMY